MTEQELVDRARAGDQSAFEQLVVEHQNKVYSLAFRMVNHREEAADLAQESFLKAWQALPTFQGESSFGTWIYRLTTNLCIDYIRRQKRRQEIQPVASLDDPDSGLGEPADWKQDPQHHVERKELRRALNRALQELPDHQRQILVMRELSGLSYQEIVQALDLDLGTVKSRIARARKNLQKILLDQGNLFARHPSKPRE